MSAGRRDRSGPSRYPRTARVNQVLREVVADELERLADVDERLRLLTVTAVDTTPDLRRAVVYVSSLPEEASLALAERRVQLQRALATQMRLKRTPQLAFEADPAVRSGAQVDRILRRIQPGAAREPSEHGEASAVGPGSGADDAELRGGAQSASGEVGVGPSPTSGAGGHGAGGHSAGGTEVAPGPGEASDA